MIIDDSKTIADRPRSWFCRCTLYRTHGLIGLAFIDVTDIVGWNIHRCNFVRHHPDFTLDESVSIQLYMLHGVKKTCVLTPGLCMWPFLKTYLFIVRRHYQPTRRTFRTTVDRRWRRIQCCRSTSMEQPTGSCHLGRNTDSIPSQT